MFELYYKLSVLNHIQSQNNFAPVEELGEAFRITDIEGTIPYEFPEGVYIRNGMHISLECDDNFKINSETRFLTHNFLMIFLIDKVLSIVI